MPRTASQLRPWTVLFLLCLALVMALPRVSMAGGEAAASPLDANLNPDELGIEDSRTLTLLGTQALERGEREHAEALFDRALRLDEVAVYLPYRDSLRKALVLERLGQMDEAAAAYRKDFDDDVLRVIQVLRILSVHPDRDALVQEALDHVRGLVDKLKAGEPALIYRTSKGKPRYLEQVSADAFLKNAQAGQKMSYCYIEDIILEADTYEGPPIEFIQLNRCVVGNVKLTGMQIPKFSLKGIVLGDVDLGKIWEGERNKSRVSKPSEFEDLVFRDAILAGRGNFSGVEVHEGRAYFPMAVFEGEADFRGANFEGVTEFRFSSFGKGANFKDLRMHAPVYFGGSRFRADTVFTGVFSNRDVYFNSVTFEGAVSFDKCEWLRSATFENAHFHGPASFNATRITAKRLNLSRAVFEDRIQFKEVHTGGLDALGAHFKSDALFTDATIDGRIRFSLDAVTREAHKDDLDGLLVLYRDYQGDEDADEPLTTKSSYGVRSLDDLVSQVDGNISFSNSILDGYTVFEGVNFGRPGEVSTASFFNTQFLGETHFERATFHSVADFTTIFGKEVAFNEAHFESSFILDDAYVSGRVTMSDATFSEAADWSWYGSALAEFQVSPSHVDHPNGLHRFFYERCALGDIDQDDPRILRLLNGNSLTDSEIMEACLDRNIDEFVGLKDSYGNRAMTIEEDDAYWWFRHYDTMHRFWYGSLFQRVLALVVDLGLFELCFGWGVRLENLGIAVLVITALFAFLYRRFCPDTILAYDGEDIPVRDVSYVGLFFVSLQSLIAINTGWDFGDDDHTFRYLNTLETLIGFIILTFFVGAYTRMILA